MTRELLAEERGDFVPTIAPKQMRNEWVSDAVVLVNRPRVVVHFIRLEHANRVPLVQQAAKLSLRPPSPVHVVLHPLRLPRETIAHAAARSRTLLQQAQSAEGCAFGHDCRSGPGSAALNMAKSGEPNVADDLVTQFRFLGINAEAAVRAWTGLRPYFGGHLNLNYLFTRERAVVRSDGQIGVWTMWTGAPSRRLHLDGLGSLSAVERGRKYDRFALGWYGFWVTHEDGDRLMDWIRDSAH